MQKGSIGLSKICLIRVIYYEPRRTLRGGFGTDFTDYTVFFRQDLPRQTRGPAQAGSPLHSDRHGFSGFFWYLTGHQGTEIVIEPQGAKDAKRGYFVGFTKGIGWKDWHNLTPTGLSDSDACIHHRRAHPATS